MTKKKMRIFSLFLCTFLVLMFGGTMTYIYLLWNTYWDRVYKLSHDYRPALRANVRHGAAGAAAIDTGGGGGRQQLPRSSGKGGSSRATAVEAAAAAPSTTTTPPFNLPPDKLLAHIKHYKQQITDQLRSAIRETGKSILAGTVKNIYHVQYPAYIKNGGNPRNGRKQSRADLLRGIRSIRIETFLRGDPFFENQQLAGYLPKKPLELFRKNRRQKNRTCAVVSSAGSLLNSGLGASIDSNDFVIRFNNAPAGSGSGFARDVGNKTSLRIVNSQVVGKPEFGFLDDKRRSLYSGDTPLLVWDPCKFNDTTLEAWYDSPDFPFFETFFAKRLMRPDSEVHLLNPFSLWRIWKWLQSTVHPDTPLLPNPPSSGFLGLVLAVQNCAIVRVYEFLPSMRLTKRCHYYDDEENLGCTLGDWHPLAAEKLLALKINSGNDSQVFSDGFITIDVGRLWSVFPEKK